MLRSLFRRSRPALPRVPDGYRVYAIGDVHGCIRQFEALLELIAADDAARGPATRITVLLGDLVDRGPDSAGVVARTMALREQLPGQVHLLSGNHEEIFLGALAGDAEMLRLFARVGGRETALSYRIDEATYEQADYPELHRLLEAAVPAAHRDFLAAADPYFAIGDYGFVHAGILPGVPLAEQALSDLRWIRSRFLKHPGPHDRFIVHGHTITERVDEQPCRLGIDTGAYATGRLTAVGLEGEERWFLQT